MQKNKCAAEVDDEGEDQTMNLAARWGGSRQESAEDLIRRIMKRAEKEQAERVAPNRNYEEESKVQDGSCSHGR